MVLIYEFLEPDWPEKTDLEAVIYTFLLKLKNTKFLNETEQIYILNCRFQWFVRLLAEVLKFRELMAKKSILMWQRERNLIL